MDSFYRACAPFLLLAALPFLLYWRVWWPESLSPTPFTRQVFVYGDFVEQHYPMRFFVASELRQGRLPLWDPYTFGGEPAVAESLFATYYPLGLWQAIYPAGAFPFWALEMEAIAHLALGGIFTFLFVRRLTGNMVAALVSGLAFSLGGFLTSYPMLQLIILETAVWLPAGLWLIERALAQPRPPERQAHTGTTEVWRGRLWRIALAGAVLACGILAGHAQTFLYIAYASGGYLLFRSLTLGYGWRFTLLAALVLGGTVLGLSAAQWLPSLELFRVSPRAALTYADVSHGFGLAELWGLLRPNPGQWSPLYAGLLPLALALLAMVFNLRGGREQRSQVWFWAVLALVALDLSLGRNGFLYPLAHAVAPGFATFRDQERAAFLVSFALAVLAGYGYVALSNSVGQFLKLSYNSKLSNKITPGFVLVIIVLDLFHANQGVILQDPPPGGYFAPTAALDQLSQDQGRPYRLSSESLLPGDGNAGLVFQVQDVTGNGPLYLADYERFLNTVPELRWWQMLNVRYILTRRALDHGGLNLILGPDRDHADQRLYQTFLGARPAWVAHAARVVVGQAAAIDLTAGAAIDPMTTAVLEQSPAVALPAASNVGQFSKLSAQEEVRIDAYDHQHVSLVANLSSPGILVLSDVFYPGWVVRINGQSATPLRAYGLLRAVALPSGQWRVEWSYEPLTVRLGLFISILVVLGLCWPLLTRRRPAAHAI
ncbi:MAG: hypothetical protein EXR62_07950 [Chloroflexi bacterium]|nr:hypothetical protein [Chloroflexota bacterium]